MSSKIKKILSLAVCIFILGLASCSYHATTPNVSDTEIPQESPTPESPAHESPTPTETEDPYVETRPPLIYIVPDDYLISDEICRAINKYLYTLGTEYSVSFIGLGSADYVETLSAHLASDKQCDILYTGMPWDHGYDALAKKGYLQSFNEYLETENGQILKNSLPNDIWYALERNGEILGVDGYPWAIHSPPSYTINTELMKKYGLTENDFKKPLMELVDILDKVKKGEGEGFFPLCSWLNFKINSGIRINDAVIVDRKTNKAGLLLDNQEYIEILKALRHMYEEGYMPPTYVHESNLDLDTFLVAFSLSTDFPYALAGAGRLTKGDKQATHEDALTVPLDGYDWYGQNIPSCTAISSKSLKKDLAFDFLTKVYTDARLSNLLLFGIEGEHYTTIDGIISSGKFDINNWLVYGNSFIATPLSYEFKNKTELYMDLHNKAKLSPICRFIFDKSNVSNIVAKTNECMKKIDSIFKKDADFNKVLEDIRQELYSLNVQALIDEVDAQVSEFLKQQ